MPMQSLSHAIGGTSRRSVVRQSYAERRVCRDGSNHGAREAPRCVGKHRSQYLVIFAQTAEKVQ